MYIQLVLTDESELNMKAPKTMNFKFPKSLDLSSSREGVFDDNCGIFFLISH